MFVPGEDGGALCRRWGRLCWAGIDAWPSPGIVWSLGDVRFLPRDGSVTVEDQGSAFFLLPPPRPHCFGVVIFISFSLSPMLSRLWVDLAEAVGLFWGGHRGRRWAQRVSGP